MGYCEKKHKLTKEVTIAADIVWKKMMHPRTHWKQITKQRREMISKCRHFDKFHLSHLLINFISNLLVLYIDIFVLYTHVIFMCTSILTCDFSPRNKWLIHYFSHISIWWLWKSLETWSNGVIMFITIIYFRIYTSSVNYIGYFLWKLCLFALLFCYIYIYQLISLVGRVFANGLGDLGSITGRIIPKILKMVLVTSLLNT